MYYFKLRVSEALIFGSWMLGQALAFAPNINEAVISAGRLMKLFSRIPDIHNPQDKPFNTADVSTCTFFVTLKKRKSDLINQRH